MLPEFDKQMKSRYQVFIEGIGPKRHVRAIRTGRRNFSTMPEAEFLSDVERHFWQQKGGCV